MVKKLIFINSILLFIVLMILLIKPNEINEIRSLLGLSPNIKTIIE